MLAALVIVNKFTNIKRLIVSWNLVMGVNYFYFI